MNDNILKEVDEIITYIKESNDYQEYIYLKNKLSKNIKANKLINEIKKCQKEIVKLEVKKENTREIEDKINKNLDELNKIPLYIQFIEKQKDLDIIFQKIKNTLNNYFYEKIN